MVATLVKKTIQNELVEGMRYGQWLRQPDLDDTKRHEAGPETLYRCLTRRDGCSHEHSALLKLSSFGQPVQGNPVYDVFLSCCRKHGDHKVSQQGNPHSQPRVRSY